MGDSVTSIPQCGSLLFVHGKDPVFRRKAYPKVRHSLRLITLVFPARR